MESTRDPIVSFYSGGCDAVGRTLTEILAWNDERLEAIHDYIQWIFPTREPSAVNPFAPLIGEATVRAFEADAALRARLRDTFDRMLAFYGLCRDGDGIGLDVLRFPARAAVWLHPGNHNHLRLTRIMDSLATLGLREDALALQRCLLERVASTHADAVSARTVGYWKRAVSPPA